MMHLLNLNQLRDWDLYTIQHDPILSIDLMERAVEVLSVQVQAFSPSSVLVQIFCGPGNNGGDGLGLARKLLKSGYRVEVFIPIYEGIRYSPDFSINLERLQQIVDFSPIFFQKLEEISLKPTGLFIDCLFGTRVRWPLPKLVAELIEHINRIKTASARTCMQVMSVDVPSGLGADFLDSPIEPIIRADKTLTLQVLKPSFLLADTGKYCGQVSVLDIKLNTQFQENLEGLEYVLDLQTAYSMFKDRPTFTHKGSYGHALLVAGSKGKSGAALLSVRACVHSGVGLVTALIPPTSVDILQSQVPEAMVLVGEQAEYLSKPSYDLSVYSSMGIGPGLGTHIDTKDAVFHLLSTYKNPMVIDADALNILSESANWTSLVNPGSILTPHVGEFDRLAGKSSSSYQRLLKQRRLAQVCRSVLILKGAYTSIAFPDGKLWFNTTGNAGMATGGSGDCLTGILTALLGSGYSPESSSLIGVYVHGLAGDRAAALYGQTYLSASNIIEQLSYGFMQLEEQHQ